MSSEEAIRGGLIDALRKAGQDAGGAEGVEKILKMFYGKMASDPLVGFFFQNKDLNFIIQQQKFFLSRSMGFAAEYIGKSPREAHRHIPPILKGHFDRRLVILREVLRECHIPEPSIKAWVDFEESFRKGIVEEEGPLSKRTKYTDR